jgi:uncharacterized protein with PQ loop repeat
MIELIGWLGAFCFAICGLPQAIKCYQTKRADDMSWLFLILWGLGEVCMIGYTVLALDSNALLLANYLANGAFLSVIIYYKA